MEGDTCTWSLDCSSAILVKHARRGSAWIQQAISLFPHD